MGGNKEFLDMSQSPLLLRLLRKHKMGEACHELMGFQECALAFDVKSAGLAGPRELSEQMGWVSWQTGGEAGNTSEMTQAEG